MLKIHALAYAALFCAALTIQACGKSSPTAPSQTPAATPDRVEQPTTPDTTPNPRPPRKSNDEHGEPPGNLPPRP
jgi:hypothetical protein